MMELWSILHTGTVTGMTAHRGPALACGRRHAVPGCAGALEGRRAVTRRTAWAAAWPRA